MACAQSFLVTTSTCPIEQASRLLYAARLSAALACAQSFLVTTSTCPIEQASRLLYAARLSPALACAQSFLVTTSTCPIEQASRLLYAARMSNAPTFMLGKSGLWKTTTNRAEVDNWVTTATIPTWLWVPVGRADWRIGKTVQIRCGPAAVTGDESYIATA